MGVSDLREKSGALGDPRHVVDDVVFYGSLRFGRDLTRWQDAEMCVFPKRVLVRGDSFVAELTLLNCACSQ